MWIVDSKELLWYVLIVEEVSRNFCTTFFESRLQRAESTIESLSWLVAARDQALLLFRQFGIVFFVDQAAASMTVKFVKCDLGFRASLGLFEDTLPLRLIDILKSVG